MKKLPKNSHSLQAMHLSCVRGTAECDAFLGSFLCLLSGDLPIFHENLLFWFQISASFGAILAKIAKIARFQAHFSEFKQVLAIFSKFATFNYVKLDIKLHFKRGYKHKIQNFLKFCYFAHSSYIINATLCTVHKMRCLNKGCFS